MLSSMTNLDFILVAMQSFDKSFKINQVTISH